MKLILYFNHHYLLLPLNKLKKHKLDIFLPYDKKEKGYYLYRSKKLDKKF